MNNLDNISKDSEQEWEQAITGMFQEIAETYEKINTFISMGMDKNWRLKQLQRLFKNSSLEKPVLDIGCGPGSLAALIKKQKPELRVVSTDISEKMLELAAGSGNAREVACCSGSSLPFIENSFSAVISAFVLRNLPDLDKFYSECKRVLEPNGIVVMLDLTQPPFPPVSLMHSIYMKIALPLGAKIYKANKDAYNYLNRSITQCEPPGKMVERLEKANFEILHVDRLFMGTVTIYTAKIP